MNKKTDNLISMINIVPNSKALSVFNSVNADKTKKTSGLVEFMPLDSNNSILEQNHDSLSILTKSPCNICPMMVWKPSYAGNSEKLGLSQLGDYETMFLNSGGSAFILLSEAIPYAKTYNPTKMNSPIVSP